MGCDYILLTYASLFLRCFRYIFCDFGGQHELEHKFFWAEMQFTEFASGLDGLS